MKAAINGKNPRILAFFFALFAVLPISAACGAGNAGTKDDAGTNGNTTTAPDDKIKIEVVATNLDTPWEISFAPDGRVFITERPGRIRVIEAGKLQEQPYATLNAVESGEGGQLGLVLDPEFAQNRYLYAYYTTKNGDGKLVNRLVRLVEENRKAREDKVLLEGPAASIHDGGRVDIGPDGKLYASLGDSSEKNLAQNREAMAGKIVRLNLDGSVPSDNPFPGSPVYSYGHRNPQGLAWHPETKRLYAPEHGPQGHDELNLIQPGGNYGWPELSGKGGAPRYIDPILESGNGTWAPSGATFISQGPWRNNLFFSALRGKSLHRVVLDANNPAQVIKDEELFKDQYGRLRTARTGPDGALYVLTSNRDGRGTPAAGDDRVLKITPPRGPVQ